jgi:hypothetical protein
MPVAGFIWLLLGLSLLGQSSIQFSSTSYLVTEGVELTVAQTIASCTVGSVDLGRTGGR